ncbi:MAG: hypothetical protein AAF869_00600 [Pseudomonadota bacterium]
MKGFEFARSHVVDTIIACTAEELGQRFKKHVDFLTISEWSADTPIGAGGLGLTDEQAKACAQRAAQFYGADASVISPKPGDRFADWGERLHGGVNRHLTEFGFTTVAGDGAIKVCRHPADEIYQDACAAASLLHGRRRIISLVSSHNIFGFAITVIAAQLQGLETVHARATPPEVLRQKLSFGDLIVATPTLWRYLAQTLGGMPDNVMGVCFGEPMSPDLPELLEALGLGAFRELYGATETGLIGWRYAHSEPFRLFDAWRRNEDCPDPERSTSLIRVRADGGEYVVESMDDLVWDTPRSFRLMGRRDKATQVGGVNVFPERIAEIIEMHPLVEACRIRIGRQRQGVNRLIAHMILAPSAAASDAVMRDIDMWCRRNLRPQERPRIYCFEPAQA